MSMSEGAFTGLLRDAVCHTARKLGVEAVDWKSANELLEEIQERDPQTRGLLTDFIDAYLSWFHFHDTRPGPLSGKDEVALAEKVKARNTTRKAILARLAELK